MNKGINCSCSKYVEFRGIVLSGGVGGGGSQT